jgi:hypothetical protein
MIARKLAELWGVRKVSITARNPRSNGQVENSMKTIKDMLTAYVKENQEDWNEHLPLIAQMYNSTINSATGMTPYYLVHGTEMNNPTQEHIEEMSVDDYHQTVRRTKEIQQWCWTYAGSRGEQNKTNYNRIPAEKLEFVPYEVGDFFYTRVIPKRAPKNRKQEARLILSSSLQFRYAGPYIITEVISPILYKAVIHNKERIVHALNMKAANRKRKLVKRIVNNKRKIAEQKVDEDGEEIILHKISQTKSHKSSDGNVNWGEEGEVKETVKLNLIPTGAVRNNGKNSLENYNRDIQSENQITLDSHCHFREEGEVKLINLIPLGTHTYENHRNRLKEQYKHLL